MDATHWHLLLNHFPILGTLFGLGLILAGMLRHKPILTNAGLLIFLLLALLTAVVFQTGEIAHEKLYMNVSEASQDWILIHQGMARQEIGGPPRRTRHDRTGQHPKNRFCGNLARRT